MKCYSDEHEICGSAVLEWDSARMGEDQGERAHWDPGSLHSFESWGRHWYIKKWKHSDLVCSSPLDLRRLLRGKFISRNWEKGWLSLILCLSEEEVRRGKGRSFHLRMPRVLCSTVGGEGRQVAGTMAFPEPSILPAHSRCSVSVVDGCLSSSPGSFCLLSSPRCSLPLTRAFLYRHCFLFFTAFLPSFSPWGVISLRFCLEG